MGILVPEFLNGYPVKAIAYHPSNDNVMVLVERQSHPVHEWVVAIWNGDSAWYWGNYYKKEQDARNHYPDLIWQNYY